MFDIVSAAQDLSLYVSTEEEVCTFRSCWSGASDDQQLRRKHPARCSRFQLLSREFHRTPAKRCCATACSTIPVNAKGKWWRMDPGPSWSWWTCVLNIVFACLLLQDVIGCTQEMDFILWPRNDIEKIVCLLFSRWKGADDEPFRPVQVSDWHFASLLPTRAKTHRAWKTSSDPTGQVWISSRRLREAVLARFGS